MLLKPLWSITSRLLVNAGRSRIKATMSRMAFGLASVALGYDAQEKLKELGCDPIAIMAELAMDTGQKPEIRAAMASQLAQYVAPKLKSIAIETRGKMETKISVVRYSEVNPEGARRLSEKATVTQIKREARIERDFDSVPNGAIIEAMRASVEGMDEIQGEVMKAVIEQETGDGDTAA